MYGSHRCVPSGGLRVWEAGWLSIFRHTWFPQGLACGWRWRGHQICVGFLPIQYPWLHFPLISHLVMVSVGWSLKVVSSKDQMWPRLHSPLFKKIWLCQVLVVVCGIFHAAHGLYGCDAWSQRLWRMVSTVVARGLTCCVACGILVSQSGTEPASSALQGGFLTTGPLGTSPLSRIWSLGLHSKDWIQLFSFIPKIVPWRDCLLKGQRYSGFWFSCPLQFL